MWKGQTVSVVLGTYAEKDSIRVVIEEFFATGVVDEVIVVNNNAEPGTAEEVEQTDARQVFEPRQGYGHAYRRGLDEATGDLVVLSEPDGTFLARDIVKLLTYSDDCDAVFGTRTTREMIWQGANMGWFLKWGNWAVAKLVEVLFNTSHLSDVGCTYRLLRRELAEAIRPGFTVGSSHFGPELMLLVIASGARFVEVPVNYLPRVGESSVTGDFGKALKLGLQMIAFVLWFRWWTAFRRPKRVALPAANAVSPQARGTNGQTDFDTVAEEYDESLPLHVLGHYLDRREAYIREHAAPGSAVLDVGCGTGVLAARLAGDDRYDVTGVDPFEGMLEHLRRREPRVRAVHADGQRLPFEKDTFDLTYCVAVMHHVADPADVRDTLAEMVRVTKPGGYILVWDHNPRNPYWPFLMRRVPQDTGAERLIPAREILDGLEAGGASPVAVQTLGFMPDFTPTFLTGAVAGIERLAERTPLLKRYAAHNVILARKDG